MKSKLKREDLLSKEDITNAVTEILSSYDLSTEDPILNKAFIVYQYYCEMESGGHESLFRWFGHHIKEMGIDAYSNILIGTLEEIEAHKYALIEKTYGKELWNLYSALENNEIHEDEFYTVIEKATDEYYKQNDSLRELLDTYFVSIFTDLIEVIEE